MFWQGCDGVQKPPAVFAFPGQCAAAHDGLGAQADELPLQPLYLLALALSLGREPSLEFAVVAQEHAMFPHQRVAIFFTV